MATLEEALLARGATGAMIESKTFKMAKEAIAEGAVDGIADAAQIAKKAEQAATSIQSTLTRLGKASDDARSLLRTVNEANDRLRDSAASVIVTSARLCEEEAMLKRKPRHMAQGRAVEPSRDYVPRHMKGQEAPLITFGAGPTEGNTEQVYRDVPIPPRS